MWDRSALSLIRKHCLVTSSSSNSLREDGVSIPSRPLVKIRREWSNFFIGDDFFAILAASRLLHRGKFCGPKLGRQSPNLRQLDE